MKQISEVTACMVDHGLGLPLARRLARDYKRVLYHSPYEEGFSTIEKAVIGTGFDDIERVDDIWKVKDEVDLWIFPDVEHSGLQLELESQGFPVWGSRTGDQFELDRELFMATLDKLGLEVPPHEVVIGLPALRELLQEKEDCYIKISKFRGSMETTHFRSWKLDRWLLDSWSVRFGPPGDDMPFLVFDNIDTPLEIGGDTYNIDGQWPELCLHGLESKDKTYLSAVTQFDKMPAALKEIMESFSHLLGSRKYRNQWSMEVRVKDDHAYFIDATTRSGFPSTASAMEIWSNLPDIIWHGAHGVMLQPDPVAKFSAEVILETKSEPGVWPTVQVPKALEQWMKLADCCQSDGVICFPPHETGGHEIGWLVALGDSPRAAIETLKGYVAQLPEGVKADITPLADILNEIEQAEKEDIKFSSQPLPEPSIVLDDA